MRREREREKGGGREGERDGWKRERQRKCQSHDGRKKERVRRERVVRDRVWTTGSGQSHYR